MDDKTDTQNLGYDFECKNPELFIEVKGCVGEVGSIRLTKREWEVAKEKKVKYLLAIVYNINEEAEIEIIEDPYKHFKDLIREQTVVVKSLHIKGKDIRSFVTSLQ